MDSSLAQEAPVTEAGEVLHARRRQSLRMMVAMSLNQSCKDAIQDVLLPSSDYLDNECKFICNERQLVLPFCRGIASRFSLATERLP